ncbi:MAG: hypothetical protein QOE36_3036, partial [Gaiellaceae bacterium]|nr:hypothetical protein [Gaiellaceae bacterium]
MTACPSTGAIVRGSSPSAAYTRAVIDCPSCGEQNPERAKFCLACGTALATAPAEPATRERKRVSVLFCDLVGFTAASESADPEDVQARIERYHRRVRGELESFGGTVEKFIGDAVMAVFGAPVAHEDDPERAVRAGLRILESIGELNEEEPGLELSVRIGVNTGEAVVSLGTRPEEGEGMVAGDVVNTAARIQAAAPVGGVAVGPETYRQTARVFVYEELPPAKMKGKAEPVQLQLARRPRARFGSDVTRTHQARFVGREVERTLLQGLFERAARDRSPQLVTLVGEPGVGKSRLVAELLRYIDERPELVSWRQGRCLPYGEGITFWALGELVKAHAGIFESDSPEIARAKLEAVLPEGEGRPWLRARVLPLLGIESGEAPPREESFTAWRRLLESIAADGPAVVVVEDLHWADPALLDFIAYLAEWASGVPLLLICTSRPELYEQHPSWAGGTRNATTINLSPLSDRETAELVSSLLTDRLLTAELQRTILERAGGNPLYAEEFVRLLNDRGATDAGDALDETAFPDSVQALIAARLDTLPAERKSLLQDAAVIGKIFWAGALADMGDHDPATLEQALHELTRKELVRPARISSMEGEQEYAFWHVLLRDAAYAQIPRPERARRHQAAARWLERKLGERVEDLAEVLVHHYVQALELAKASGEEEHAAELVPAARRFLRLAGERALGLDTRQAEAWLARALELSTAEDPEWPELLVRWADAAVQAGQLRQASDAIREALPTLRERGDTSAVARVLLVLGRTAPRLGEGRGVPYMTEAVALLEEGEPGPELVEAVMELARAHSRAGAMREGRDAAARALELAEQLAMPVPAAALGIWGYARTMLGEFDGVPDIERALALQIEQGAGLGAAGLMNNLALTRYLVEGPVGSLAATDEAVLFSEQRGLLEMSRAYHANRLEDLVETGDVDGALSEARRLAAELEG